MGKENQVVVMKLANNWIDLFTHSSFFCVNKIEEGPLLLKNNQESIVYDKVVDGFHPSRKDEFLLGRLCASKAYQLRTGNELVSLPAAEDRSPIWPTGVVGSISHSKTWIGAAVSESINLVGVGIDFEQVGRARSELSSHIRSECDLKNHKDLSEKELLTIIFSCKESLYKSLYPTVRKFFGFEDAAIKEINLKENFFLIELLTQLTPEFGPESRYEFIGKIAINNGDCLTVLEIPHASLEK